jgi:hypothetical protein
MYDNSMFKVRNHSASQHDALDISTGCLECLHALFVRDALDVLFDDGAFVECFGHIVCGGAYHLYATLPGPSVRACPLKRGQECMVDVYDRHFNPMQHVTGEYLHVAGEYRQLNVVLLEKLYDESLLLSAELDVDR